MRFQCNSPVFAHNKITFCIFNIQVISSVKLDAGKSGGKGQFNASDRAVQFCCGTQCTRSTIDSIVVVIAICQNQLRMFCTDVPTDGFGGAKIKRSAFHRKHFTQRSHGFVDGGKTVGKECKLMVIDCSLPGKIPIGVASGGKRGFCIRRSVPVQRKTAGNQ
ncbi:hypothetical protein EVA_07215 [gut metagenome]|uniref:Uncharacterized protein n=1 Tax=gut metagenome TaxID=749906 RepID=J9GVT0_9ZZZZ